jgi:NAD(P)-dependent dehydrogenase (short-subunit alcohol dehydrogenase family)
MTLNLRAAFLVARATLPALLRSPVGRLIAVGSRAGITPSPGIGAYAVSKAALHALVQTIAEEVQGTGTTANAVVPGIIDTPANRVDMSSADFSKWVKPEAIAELIIYLASDEGAAVNGALIPAYGSG